MSMIYCYDCDTLIDTDFKIIECDQEGHEEL